MAGKTADIAGHEETLLLEAIATTPVPMLVTDPRRPDNPIVLANRAFLDLTLYREGEVIGRNPRFLQGQGTDRETVARLARAVAARQAASAELLNYRKDGSAFRNALFLCPVAGHTGDARFFFSTQIDVTHRGGEEEALRLARRMEALGLSACSTAHDVNAILQVILGSLERMEERLGDHGDGEVMAALGAIGRAAERGTALTRRLLGSARRGEAKGGEAGEVSLNTLVEALLPMTARLLGEGIAIETSLERHLWTVRLDPVRAEMAILNLVMNARDAMRDGGCIRLTTANREVTAADAPPGLRAGPHAVLVIEDDGAGMSPDVLARALDPFFTTKEADRGTGLGLAMVSSFMRQSAGGLAITSEEGRGTAVSLHFPAAGRGEPAQIPETRNPETRDPETRNPETRDPETRKPGKGARDQALRGTETVLVVEDQPDIATLAAAILTDHGYSVVAAPNGDEALALLEGGARVDLLFSDLVMPGTLNGLTLARAARRLFPSLRVLLATGFATEAVEREGPLAGEFGILGKPYRRAELLGRIRAALDGGADLAAPAFA